MRGQIRNLVGQWNELLFQLQAECQLLHKQGMMLECVSKGREIELLQERITELNGLLGAKPRRSWVPEKE